MNSKEALDKLFMAVDEELLYEQCGVIFATELTEVVEQNLDRLEKLEKALDILKEVVSLNSNMILETERQFLRLSKEEYELLKEVLGDD